VHELTVIERTNSVLRDAIFISMTRLFHTVARWLRGGASNRSVQATKRITTVSVYLLAGLSACTHATKDAQGGHSEIRSAASAPAAGQSGTALVVEPAAGVKPVVRAIDSAGHTIFLEAYILTQRSIVRALQRASAQGVAVYVLLDPHPYGMGRQPIQMAAVLRAAGVSVRWTSRQYYFTHAKFFVIDDRLAVVSTANFSQAAFTSNRELLVVDHNREDVHDLSNVFRSDWDHIPVGQHNAELVLSPGSRPILWTFLARARRSIEVYAEEVGDPALDQQLIQLHRHVRVEVLVARSYTSPGLSTLLRAGVAVRGLHYPYIHAKMFLEDGRVAFLGSENLSPTSLDLNREVGILVQGGTVARASSIFALDWTRAVVLHPSRAG
jgi:cardiolipin synthase A/B